MQGFGLLQLAFVGDQPLSGVEGHSYLAGNYALPTSCVKPHDSAEWHSCPTGQLHFTH